MGVHHFFLFIWEGVVVELAGRWVLWAPGTWFL